MTQSNLFLGDRYLKCVTYGLSFDVRLVDYLSSGFFTLNDRTPLLRMEIKLHNIHSNVQFFMTHNLMLQRPKNI